MVNNANQVIRGKMFMPRSGQWLHLEGAVKRGAGNRSEAVPIMQEGRQ